MYWVFCVFQLKLEIFRVQSNMIIVYSFVMICDIIYVILKKVKVLNNIYVFVNILQFILDVLYMYLFKSVFFLIFFGELNYNNFMRVLKVFVK